MRNHLKLRALCECAIFTALALALSYAKVDVAALGGSISLVMIPLVLCAIRWGVGYGLAAGLVFGTLKFFIGGGHAVNWESMLLDYTLAYTFVGFAGLLKGKSKTAWLAALIGGLGRFLIHYISGITIYAIVEDTTIFGVTTSNPWLYSLLYNGAYMVPNIILTVAAVALLAIPLGKYMRREDLRTA